MAPVTPSPIMEQMNKSNPVRMPPPTNGSGEEKPTNHAVMSAMPTTDSTPVTTSPLVEGFHDAVCRAPAGQNTCRR